MFTAIWISGNYYFQINRSISYLVIISTAYIKSFIFNLFYIMFSLEHFFIQIFYPSLSSS
jgi:hypothetical protein